MSEAFKFTVGGAEVALPSVITLGPIKAFNPALKEFKAGEARRRANGEEVDLVDLTALAARIVSPAILKDYPHLTVEVIDEQLRPDEMPGLRNAMWEVLVLSGLYTRVETKPGEAKPPETPAGQGKKRTSTSAAS